ncbi:MAG: hypothetical protein WA191_06175 [Telluria sp.]|nr:hypothetical protein [Telluria sp.]
MDIKIEPAQTTAAMAVPSPDQAPAAPSRIAHLTLIEANALGNIPRRDVVTARKVEVGIIFQAMLGTADAADYMLKNGVPLKVVLRVLTQPSARRGSHNACGIRVDSPALSMARR